jgi:hypothetical protein
MRKQVEAAIHALITTPSWYFLIGGVERILAVILQISLSVLVWFAAKKKNRIYYYPLAIVLHLIVDAGAVILSGRNASPLVVEVVVAAFTVLSVLIAGMAWQENAGDEPQGRFSGSSELSLRGSCIAAGLYVIICFPGARPPWPVRFRHPRVRR